MVVPQDYDNIDTLSRKKEDEDGLEEIDNNFDYETNEGSELNVKCRWYTLYRAYPDPKDCKKYYVCHRGVFSKYRFVNYRRFCIRKIPNM